MALGPALDGLGEAVTCVGVRRECRRGARGSLGAFSLPVVTPTTFPPPPATLGARYERDAAYATHIVVWRTADTPPTAVARLEAGAAVAVSPLWLWQCVASRALVPVTDPLWRPMAAPLAGLDGIEVTLTGVLGDLRAAVLALGEAAGLRCTRPMNLATCTHLLAADVRDDGSEKLRRAREPAHAGRISVVSLSWLYDCVRSGRVLPAAAYRRNAPNNAMEPAAVLVTSSSMGALGREARGEARAVPTPFDKENAAPPLAPTGSAPPVSEAAGSNATAKRVATAAAAEEAVPSPAFEPVAAGGSGTDAVVALAEEEAMAAGASPPADYEPSQPIPRVLHFSQVAGPPSACPPSAAAVAAAAVAAAAPSPDAADVGDIAAVRGRVRSLIGAVAPVDTQAPLVGAAVAAAAVPAAIRRPTRSLAALAASRPEAPRRTTPPPPREKVALAAARPADESGRSGGRKRGPVARDAAADPPADAIAAGRAKQRKVTCPARAAVTASQPAVEAAPAAPAVAPAPSPRRPSTAPRQNRRPFFAVGGLHSADAAAAVASLRRLGVTAEGGAAAHAWRTGTTHVLEPTLRRSLKTLAAMAAGAWVLDARYAADSAAAGRLLPEGRYELVAAAGGRVARRAPAHWRRRASADGGGGAFAGLTAAVLPAVAPKGAHPNKEDLEAVLAAGGATLVDASAAATAGADFVVAPPTAGARDGRTAALRRARVPLVTAAFVVEWVAHPSGDLSEYVLFQQEVGERLARAAAERGGGVSV